MKTHLLFFLLFVNILAGAQNVRTVVINADTSSRNETFSIPYSEIKVIEARFDRTKIGCCYNSGFLNNVSFEKYNATFPDSLHTYLPKFLNRFVELTPSSKDKLIILVKQFRMADHCLRGIDADPVEIELTLKISASFYAFHEDRCFKLFSVDNILLHNIEKPRERNRKFEEGSRSFALQEILRKLLQNQNWQINTSQPSFTLVDIESAIQKRFDLPLYNATLKKCIFKNFADFKNNAPSSEEFSILYKEGKIDRVEDKNGKPYAIESLWGICDGVKNYMRVRDGFCELIPNDKSFRVFSYAVRSELAGSAGGYDLMSSTLGRIGDGFKVKQYFDLDMETGKLYLQEVFGKSSISFQ